MENHRGFKTSPTVLLVEDTLSAEVHLKQLLGGHFRIIRTTGGSNIKHIIRDSFDNITIIVDLFLERGYKNSLQLVKKLREEYPTLLILVWSKAPAKCIEEALNAGANKAFRKYCEDDETALINVLLAAAKKGET